MNTTVMPGRDPGIHAGARDPFRHENTLSGRPAPTARSSSLKAAFHD
jgi:hypothetical protein